MAAPSLLSVLWPLVVRLLFAVVLGACVSRLLGLVFRARFRARTPERPCPNCNRAELRLVAKGQSYRRYRCPRCRWEFRFRAGEPTLPLSALQFEVDRTTCGTLLKVKRQVDPATLIHHARPRPSPKKKTPILLEDDTAVGRLLASKRLRHGEPVPARAPGALWDRWLDS